VQSVLTLAVSKILQHLNGLLAMNDGHQPEYEAQQRSQFLSHSNDESKRIFDITAHEACLNQTVCFQIYLRIVINAL
jgi:hypothetical protein